MSPHPGYLTKAEAVWLVAAACDVSPRTARRWLDGDAKPRNVTQRHLFEVVAARLGLRRVA